MPLWAKSVEFVVVLIYKYSVCPTFRFIKFVYFLEGCRVNDETTGIVDDLYYWNEVLKRAIDALQYPEFPVPEDLAGFDRIIWRLRSNPQGELPRQIIDIYFHPCEVHSHEDLLASWQR
ncbi:hypothetical protein FKW77_009329 [Venturia effusa]|uniref:Uncharacterized protein n=1 Tax=Venturia effusa TaxID=50376 RepID=A0A517L460_9PEZI|nr:hypothetical protein FKW77_009329 [Venturia effusa]